jgi:Transglycosylase SLT domain
MNAPGLSYDYTQSADAPSAATQDNTQDIGSGGGALVKATGKTISPVGNIAMDPTQTAELLANMQQMVDDRTGAGSQFMRGLERASAWGSGGVQGPSQALATLNAQQQREDESVFNMRQQMAAYKSAAAQQERLGKEIGNITGGGVGGAGYQIPPEIQQAMRLAGNYEEKKKVFTDWAKDNAKIMASPEWMKPTRYVDANGNIDEKPLYLASKMADPNNKQNIAVFNQAQFADQVSPLAVQKVESNNNPLAVSRAGAEGVMQVMPNTQTDPGFGVTPAKDKSPEELKRVGVDYYNAMRDRYKNDDLAAVAYNMGPGKTDAWLKSGASFNSLPQETKEYIGRVRLANAQLNRSQEQNVAAPTRRVSMGEAEANLAFQKEQAKTTAEASRKEIEGFKSATEMGSVNNQIYLAKRLGELTTKYKDNPRIVNLLNNPDMTSAVAGLIAEGLTTPVGQISFKGLENAFQKVMPNATKEEINARQEIQQILKSYALEASKVASGQGAMSDFERQMFEQIAGSTSNSMDMLRRVQQVMQARATFNDKVGRAYEDSYQAGKPQDFQLFKKSPEYRTLVQQHRDSLLNITKDLEANPSGAQTQNKAAPSTGTTSGGVKWKVVQ